MSETPRYSLRLPLYLKEAIQKVKGNQTMTAWILEAVIAKLNKESSQSIYYSKKHD